MRGKNVTRSYRLSISGDGEKNPTTWQLADAERAKGPVEFSYSIDEAVPANLGLELRGTIRIEIIKLHPAAAGSFLLSGLYRFAPATSPIKVEGWYMPSPVQGFLCLIRTETLE